MKFNHNDILFKNKKYKITIQAMNTILDKNCWLLIIYLIIL